MNAIFVNDAALPAGARERLDEFARETGTTPPACVLVDEGEGNTFSTEFLRYCQENDLSLDWLWWGKDSITDLPFVRDTTPEEQAAGLPPRLFWCVQPTGDYGKDCITGGEYGQQALAYMAKRDFPLLLTWAVLDMMRAGPEHSGIEVGFMSHMAGRAMICQQVADQMKPVKQPA